METAYALALLNSAVLAASALALWWWWRREAAKVPAFVPPTAAPPVPAGRLLSELAAAQASTADLLREARRQLERVERAFESGLRDGRPR